MPPTLKPYPAYKPSGVEWLGEIPNHWEVKKIKHGYDIQLGKMLQPDKKNSKDIEKPYLRAANLSWKGTLLEDVKSMWFSPEELEKFKLQKGDVLISEGGDVGRSCYWDSDLELYIQNAITRARSKSKIQFSKYLYYWMYHLKNIGQIDSICNAATIAHFTADKVKETLSLEPPIDEQHRIATFLDQKTAEIDEAISKKQRLIELLKEQKAILINQAVTKGLNPNVPMRDSGVEWIGEVPAHWEVRRGKRTFTPRKELARPNDIQLSATQAYGVIAQADYEKKIGRKIVKILQHLEKRRHVEVDDFVISMRSFQGGLERAWVSGCIRSSYIVLQPATNLVVGYFTYLFKSIDYIKALQATANFIRDGQDLNFENFCEVDVPFPPIEEQRQIAQALDDITGDIASAIERSQCQIDRLQEYRTILIVNVVTGKLDVREDASHEG